jgi:hypothetical protein
VYGGFPARVITQHCMQILLISDYKSLYLSYYKLVIAREYCTVYLYTVQSDSKPYLTELNIFRNLTLTFIIYAKTGMLTP